MKAPLLLALATALASGCTTTTGRAYTAERRPARGSLGTVAVLTPRLTTIARDAAPAKAREARVEVSTALRLQRGASIADPAALEAELGLDDLVTPVSDFQAVIAARKVGAIDTVCLVTVGAYDGTFSILVPPPLFTSSTHVLYSLRLVDVRTGKLVLDAVRSVETGGLFAVRTATDLSLDLARDLGSVLRE